MTSRESHQHCNAFSLVMICDGTDDGQLFDCQGETFSLIKELTDKIVNIQTLKKKPKLILIKRCNGNNITYYNLFNTNWHYSYNLYYFSNHYYNLLILVTLAGARKSKLPEVPCQPDTFIGYSEIKGNRYFITLVFSVNDHC